MLILHPTCSEICTLIIYNGSIVLQKLKKCEISIHRFQMDFGDFKKPNNDTYNTLSDPYIIWPKRAKDLKSQRSIQKIHMDIWDLKIANTNTKI